MSGEGAIREREKRAGGNPRLVPLHSERSRERGGPQGWPTAPVRPGAAGFHDGLQEFVLPYEAVRTAPDPDAALLAFLESTYDAAAERADWDRERFALGDPRTRFA